MILPKEFNLPFIVDISKCRNSKIKTNAVSGIYKITNPKGKVYIGFSSNIENRFVQYRYYHCKFQKLLLNSLKKYGVENHTFEIIHLCDDSELEYWEIHYGKLYNVNDTKYGLNIRECGGRRGKLGESTKKLMSESKKGEKNHNFGKKMSEERKKIQSEKMSGANNPNYNKTPSDETRKKQSKAHSGKKNPFYDKKHTPETLKMLSEKGRNISDETRKKRSESMMGEKHHFYNKKHKKSSIKKMSKSAKNRTKQPFQDRNHTEASKKLIREKALKRFENKENHPSYKKPKKKSTIKKISKTLKNKDWKGNHPNKGRKKSQNERKGMSERAKKRTGDKNHFWNKHHTKKTKNLISKLKSIKVNQYDLSGKFIKTWSSIKKASEKLNIYGCSISRVCMGKQKKAGGYIWKYT